MTFLSHIIGLLIPVAHADLDDWGSGGAGVSAMWSQIRSSVFTTVAGGDVVTGITRGIVSFVFPLIAASATILIIYAGIRMIISQGKEDGYTEGKKIIMYALAGLILSLLARSFIQFFVQGFLPEFLR